MTDRLQTELAETTKGTPEIKRVYFLWNADLTQRFILSHPDFKMVRNRFSVYFVGVLSSVDSAARIGRWQGADKREISALKLPESAKLLYLRCTVFHEKGATW